jgi:hypothetical protein
MNRFDDITIERYLDGGMSSEEQDALRAAMADDPELRRRVMSEESMMRALRVDRDATQRNHAEMRSRLIAAIPTIAPSTMAPTSTAPRSRPHLRLRWPIIAIVALVGAWAAIDLLTLDDAVPPVRRAPGAAARAGDGASSRAAAPSGAAHSARATPAAAASEQSAPAHTNPLTPSVTAARQAPASSKRAKSRPSSVALDGAAEPSPAKPPEAASPLPKRTNTVAKTPVRIDGNDR